MTKRPIVKRFGRHNEEAFCAPCTVPKFVPTPPLKCAHPVSLKLTPETADQAHIYCSNSLSRHQCENTPPNLLTGGLLVRIQPEEPAFADACQETFVSFGWQAQCEGGHAEAASHARSSARDA